MRNVRVKLRGWAAFSNISANFVTKRLCDVVLEGGRHGDAVVEVQQVVDAGVILWAVQNTSL